MRRLLLVLAGAALLCLPSSLFAAAASVDPRVRLNSIGFTPDAPKEATVAATASRFRVIRLSDDAVVLEGDLGAAVRTAAGDTDETVQVARFSALQAEGDYQVDIPGVGRSAVFRIDDAVWTEPFTLVTRALYLWRCGTAVEGTWQGRTYRHAACHLEDGWLDYVGGGHVQRDGTGGWHDAGDYNKYVVNAGVSVGLLFKAWEHFRDRIEGAHLRLPESTNAVPDFLDEIRWELEWLLKMQAPDGRVYHKLSELNFGYWGPPENDPGARYFVPWSSTATADFAAMMALAGRHFQEFDEPFAEQCLAAARLAWSVLAANPAHVAPDQTGFSTGGYEADDRVHRLWAAAELWATTREDGFLQEFEQRAATVSFSTFGPSWGDVGDLGLGTYLETESDARDPALVQRLRTSLAEQTASVIRTIDEHAYGRGLGGNNWWWGANGLVAAQTYLLHLADRLMPDPKFRAAAEKSLGFLFGRNYHNRSYVTGLGHEPPLHPHDRRGEPAWPGYLVGGGHPTGRSWRDLQSDYEQNEIALNWNTALTYALAAFAQPDHDASRYDWVPFPRGTHTRFQPEFGGIGAVSFAATGLPHWAALDPATGAISGRPADDPATSADERALHRSVTIDAISAGEIVARRFVNLMTADAGSDIQVINLSTRGLVGREQQPMIAGFVSSAGPARPLLIRAVGPTLTVFNLTGVLADPRLILRELATQAELDRNDDWGQLPDVALVTATTASAGGFPLTSGSKDAVLLATSSGATAVAEGAGAGSGVAIVEVYETNPADRSSQLVNLSTRAFVGTGEDALVAGIVLRGGGSVRLLLRAVGPTLSAFRLTNPLADPTITLYSGQTVLATNDNWGSAGDAAEVVSASKAAGAFDLPAGSADAALLVRLPSGSFTARVEGRSGGTGVALFELYVLP